MNIALIGQPGQSPRLMLANPKEGTVLQNTDEGEVCVFVNGLGSWVISDDGQSAALAE